MGKIVAINNDAVVIDTNGCFETIILNEMCQVSTDGYTMLGRMADIGGKSLCLDISKDYQSAQIYIPMDEVIDISKPKAIKKPTTKKTLAEKEIYSNVYKYYLSKDLVKHTNLTEPMKKAMSKAIKELSLDEKHMERMLDRHKDKVEKSKNGDYPCKKRTLAEFFGQKKYNSVELICSDYHDDVYVQEEVDEFSKYR